MAEYSASVSLSTIDGSNGFRVDGIAAADNVGVSVSVGNVNGDRYADLLIGGDGVNSNAGAAYVLFGKRTQAATIDLSTLNGTTGSTLASGDAGAFVGGAVTARGDFNGDGIVDIVAGAIGPNGFAGAAYVVFGKASGWTASVDLSALDGSDGFAINGLDGFDFLGRSVASAGDINGDGNDDIIVGANLGDVDPGDNAGEAYVIFGKSTPWAATFDLTSLNALNGFKILGLNDSDSVGQAVGSAGDINGDGLADLLVSATGADPDGTDAAGATFVVFGRELGWGSTLDLSALDGDDGFRVDGAGASDQSGNSVASAGDFNGDGFDDIIVGAQSADPGGVNGAGSSYIVFGKASGWDPTMDLSSLDGTNGFKLDGFSVSESSGVSVACAGDFNADGYSDVVIGAYTGAGKAYVYFGRASGFSPAADLSTLDGDNGIRFDGASAGDAAGFAVAGAGDVNGDKIDDIILGANQADPGGDNSAGSAYVIYGALPGAAVTRIGSITDQVIRGGKFNDLLNGMGGRDQLQGQGGNDTLIGGDGKDVLDGGSGSDTASYDGAATGVTVSLAVIGYQATGGAGQDALRAIENLAGSSFNDSLTGDGGGNRLDGGAGSDTLAGGDGADELHGGGLRDTLLGGAGADSLYGEGGADVFAFTAITDSTNAARDTIFDLGQGHVIDIAAIDANLVAGGDQAFVFVANFTGAVGQARLAYSAGSDRTFLQLDQDGDGSADFVLAIKGDHRAFTDFVL